MTTAERTYRIVLEVWSKHPFYREIVTGAARYFAEKDSWIDFSKAMRFEPSRVDGAVVAVSSERIQAEWKSQSATVVNFSNSMPESGFPSVLNDDRATGRMAAEYLHGKGYRNFVFLYDNPAQYAFDRGRGFREWLDGAGFPVTVIQSANRFREAIPGLAKPTALYASEDDPGLQAISLGSQAGLSIPDDLAVLGTNNDPVSCLMGKPPLSSIVIDTVGIGYRAAQLLDELLQEHPPPKEPLRLAPRRVLERRSTSAVGFENVVIGRVASLMIDNLADPLTMEQIALRVGMSVKTIERLFRRELDTTPRQFLQQQRFEYAERLLKHTEASIAEVAERCGYAEYTKFSRAFRRHTGVSPGQWRARQKEA